MSIIEYYAHDHPASPTPLRLESLSEERLSKLAFLFGGVGDGVFIFVDPLPDDKLIDLCYSSTCLRICHWSPPSLY